MRSWILFAVLMEKRSYRRGFCRPLNTRTAPLAVAPLVGTRANERLRGFCVRSLGMRLLCVKLPLHSANAGPNRMHMHRHAPPASIPLAATPGEPGSAPQMESEKRPHLGRILSRGVTLFPCCHPCPGLSLSVPVAGVCRRMTGIRQQSTYCFASLSHLHLPTKA